MAREERSAGFILYRLGDRDGTPAERAEFLLLDYGRHWDFAKGHLEPGESDLAAAKRELREETGIVDVRVDPTFAHEITYFFRHKNRGLIRKTVIFFLGEVSRDAVVTLSHEHAGYTFAPIDAALRQVTYASAKAVLRAAYEALPIVE